MGVLGFRNSRFQIGDEKHIQYYSRHFGYVFRPARFLIAHDPYAPGLHHLCLRVESEDEVECGETTQGKEYRSERSQAVSGVYTRLLCRFLQ